MSLTPEEIQRNWETHLKIVDSYIESPRKERILEVLNSLEEKMILAPASGKLHFHNAFPGGYIDHINRVVKCSLKTKDLWESLGATIDFTEEELVFSALFHDFGKIGDGEYEGYVPQTNKWRLDNMNEAYTPNKNLPFMLIQDRSLYLLQLFGITCSFNEYLGIRVHDGIYDDANKAYYIVNNPDSKFRTNLPDILHQADLLAARIEYNKWQEHPSLPKPNTSDRKKKEVKSSENLLNLVKNI